MIYPGKFVEIVTPTATALFNTLLCSCEGLNVRFPPLVAGVRFRMGVLPFGLRTAMTQAPRRI